MKILGFVIVQGALDAAEASVVIVEQDGWDFKTSNRAVIQKPASQGYLLRREARWAKSIELYYLPTDLISGTNPGSRSAYETPLYVVPMSKARTSFLDDPV